MPVARPTFHVEMYTTSRKIEGDYQPSGALFADINAPDKKFFFLLQATVSPLLPDSVFRPVTVPELDVNKNDVLLFFFHDRSVIEQIPLLKRIIQTIVYTPMFALRGDFHLGAEQHPKDMFDTMKGSFQVMTDTTIVPLAPMQIQPPSEQSMIIINTLTMQLYYPVHQE